MTDNEIKTSGLIEDYDEDVTSKEQYDIEPIDGDLI